MGGSDVEPVQVVKKAGVVGEGVGLGSESQVQQERGGRTGRLDGGGGVRDTHKHLNHQATEFSPVARE